MPAKHIALGEPAHDLERQAIRRIVDGLPDTFTVYSNAWLVERGDGGRGGSDGPTSMILEVDVIVAAPHAIYVVELKAYRNEVTGNDNDWYIPHPIRSPLRLNRRTAQVLKSALARQSYDAGRVSVEHVIFLSHTTQVRIEGPASEGRIHTVKTILDELRTPAGLRKRLGNQMPPPVDAHTAAELESAAPGHLHQREAAAPADPRVRAPPDRGAHRSLRRALRAARHLAAPPRPPRLPHRPARRRGGAPEDRGRLPLGGAGARQGRAVPARPPRQSAVPRRGRALPPVRALLRRDAVHVGRAPSQGALRQPGAPGARRFVAEDRHHARCSSRPRPRPSLPDGRPPGGARLALLPPLRHRPRRPRPSRPGGRPAPPPRPPPLRADPRPG